MVRVIERQDRGKNCPAAILTPRQTDVALGPLRLIILPELSGPVQGYRTPHIAQYPFEIVSRRGGVAPICLVFIGYRASIAEIPLPLRMLSKGETFRKGGRGYRTQLAMLGHQNPIARNRGVSLR